VLVVQEVSITVYWLVAIVVSWSHRVSTVEGVEEASAEVASQFIGCFAVPFLLHIVDCFDVTFLLYIVHCFVVLFYYIYCI
jgi:hypothetical protein